MAIDDREEAAANPFGSSLLECWPVERLIGWAVLSTTSTPSPSGSARRC